MGNTKNKTKNPSDNKENSQRERERTVSIEGAPHHPSNRIVQIDVLVHHASRIAAKLQRHLLLARVALNLPANLSVNE
jgi:hypothetical protein